MLIDSNRRGRAELPKEAQSLTRVMTISTAMLLFGGAASLSRAHLHPLTDPECSQLAGPRAAAPLQTGRVHPVLSIDPLPVDDLYVHYSARELPPPPSSAGLFVSAALSLGAWQVVRSARHLRLGCGPLPDWYHAGAPMQVGHTVAFELNYTDMPLCFAAVPSGDPPRSVLPSVASDAGTLCALRPWTAPVRAPRAPPLPNL